MHSMIASGSLERESQTYIFQKLTLLFMDSSTHPQFQTVSVNFINVIFHSVEDMNYRVYLQQEFTLQGLDKYFEMINEICYIFWYLLTDCVNIQWHILVYDHKKKFK